MNNKTAAALEKILALKSKGNFTKAIEKIDDLIKLNSDDPDLYVEAMDLCLESGETLKAWSFFKMASSASQACGDKVWAFAKEKVKTQNDLVLAKLLMEQAIRKRDLESGRLVAYNLENHSAKELLRRVQVKKKSLLSSLGGDGTLKGELLVNVFSEALLLLRVGRNKEAAKTFVHILDQKPVEKEALEPFLVNLEKSASGNSSIYYALGCCYLTAEKLRKAIQYFSQSTNTNSAFLDEIIDRLHGMRHTDRPLPENLEIVLAESLLMKGTTAEAGELMMHVLDQRPERANLVFDLASKYGNDTGESNELDFPYIEAAILAKQGASAMERIRAIYEARSMNTELMEWFERKYTEHLLPSDILIQYGEIALTEGMFERAARVLADVADMSPVDLPAICRLIEPYRESTRELQEVHERLSKQLIASTGSAAASTQTFEKSEFAFTTEDASSLDTTFAFTTEDAPTPDTGDDPWREASVPLESPYRERELTLSEDDDEPGEETSSPPHPGPADAIGLEDSPPVGDAAAPDVPPQLPYTDDAGDAPEPDAPPQLPHTDDAGDAPDPTEEVPSPEPAPPCPPEGFDARYRAFLDGLMGDDEIISLIDDAFTEGEPEKLRILLSFKPDGLAEDTKRKLYLAQYYLFSDTPLEALAVLKSIPLDSVGKDVRKDVLLKLAACYRSVHLYEAAQGALLKIKVDHPSSEVIEHLLRQNYADYLEHQSSGAIVLEKTGNID